MKLKIIIVGAGPVGLYLACTLKARGCDVIAVDPRTGPYNKDMKKGDDPSASAYTRPTYLSKTIFNLIASKLNIKFSDKALRHVQIKDLERSLYDHAEELKVNIQKASFEGFSTKGVAIRDAATKEVTFIGSYLVFDASGKRVVVKAVNDIATKEYKAKPPFIINRIADNPVKKHFIANVKLNDETHADLIENHALLFFLPDYEFRIRNTEAAKRLKEKHGWKFNSPPYFKPVRFKGNKVIFHYEIPEDLKTEEQQIDYLQTLILLKTGKKMEFKQFETRKFLKKPRFMSFDVDPHEVIPGHYAKEQKVEAKISQHEPDSDDDIYAGNDSNDDIYASNDADRANFLKIEAKEIPDVIPVGDAAFQSDHRLSKAISDSIERIDILIKSSSINDGILCVDYKKYEESLQSFNSTARERLRKLYSQRRKELTEDFEHKFQESLEEKSSSYIDRLDYDFRLKYTSFDNYFLKQSLDILTIILLTILQKTVEIHATKLPRSLGLFSHKEEKQLIQPESKHPEEKLNNQTQTAVNNKENSANEHCTTIRN